MRIDPFFTERLSVRDWRPMLGDGRAGLEADLAAMLTPPVLKHLPPALQLGPEGISGWIDARARESDVLAVERKADGALTGLVLLAPEPDPAPEPAPGAQAPPHLHIGYLLAESAWGQGLATELLQGLVPALAESGPARLLGGVDEANPASARVLEKAGFTRDADLSAPPVDVYARDIG